jgi:hypothetical protein
MDEPPDLASDFTSFQKDMGTINIVLGKLKAITERIVNMGLSSKVHNGVDFFSDEKVVDEISTGDISFHKLEVGRGFRRIKVLQIRTVIKLVKHNNFVVRVAAN